MELLEEFEQAFGRFITLGQALMNHSNKLVALGDSESSNCKLTKQRLKQFSMVLSSLKSEEYSNLPAPVAAAVNMASPFLDAVGPVLTSAPQGFHGSNPLHQNHHHAGALPPTLSVQAGEEIRKDTAPYARHTRQSLFLDLPPQANVPTSIKAMSNSSYFGPTLSRSVRASRAASPVRCPIQPQINGSNLSNTNLQPQGESYFGPTLSKSVRASRATSPVPSPIQSQSFNRSGGDLSTTNFQPQGERNFESELNEFTEGILSDSDDEQVDDSPDGLFVNANDHTQPTVVRTDGEDVDFLGKLMELNDEKAQRVKQHSPQFSAASPTLPRAVDMRARQRSDASEYRPSYHHRSRQSAGGQKAQGAPLATIAEAIVESKTYSEIHQKQQHDGGKSHLQQSELPAASVASGTSHTPNTIALELESTITSLEPLSTSLNSKSRSIPDMLDTRNFSTRIEKTTPSLQEAKVESSTVVKRIIRPSMADVFKNTTASSFSAGFADLNICGRGNSEDPLETSKEVLIQSVLNIVAANKQLAWKPSALWALDSTISHPHGPGSLCTVCPQGVAAQAAPPGAVDILKHLLSPEHRDVITERAKQLKTAGRFGGRLLSSNEELAKFFDAWLYLGGKRIVLPAAEPLDFVVTYKPGTKGDLLRDACRLILINKSSTDSLTVRVEASQSDLPSSLGSYSLSNKFSGHMYHAAGKNHPGSDILIGKGERRELLIDINSVSSKAVAISVALLLLIVSAEGSMNAAMEGDKNGLCCTAYPKTILINFKPL